MRRNLRNERKNAQSGTIFATLHAFAMNIGITDEALARKLTIADVDYKGHELLPMRDIVRAIHGDKEQAMARKLQLECMRIEREEAEARRELVRIPEMEKLFWEQGLMPTRQALEQMPQIVAPLCTSPEAAAKALREWLENFKKHLVFHKP